MKYGVPYQGSKSFLAERIIDILPRGGTFYDVFSGGCAMAHCAALSGKWSEVVVNDINPFGQELFSAAIYGNLPPINHFVSREEFFEKRDTDPYISIMWSFGYNQRDYMYSKLMEHKKREAHKQLFSQGILPNLRLEHIERRRRIDRIKESLVPRHTIFNFKNCDYKEVSFCENGVIYCDIPYENTNNKYKQGMAIQYEEFYEWAKNQKLPVYVSSYNMPQPYFTEVYSARATQRMSRLGSSRVIEKLFIANK